MKEHKADYYFKWSLRVYMCVSVCLYLCCVVARALPDICLSRWACCWIQPSALCILPPTASELHLQAHVWSQDSEIWAQDKTSFIKHIKKDVFFLYSIPGACLYVLVRWESQLVLRTQSLWEALSVSILTAVGRRWSAFSAPPSRPPPPENCSPSSTAPLCIALCRSTRLSGRFLNQ